MSSALLLIDYQEAICRADGIVGGPSGIGPEAERRDILAAAERCLSKARDAGFTIAFVHVGFDEHATLKTNRSPVFAEMASALMLGEPGTAICHEVEPRPDEPVIVKQWVDPFVNSPLDGLLRKSGVSTLFIGGVTTSHAIESSARHAGDLGYQVNVVEDMCASFSKDAHETSLAALPVFAEVISEQRFGELASSGA